MKKRKTNPKVQNVLLLIACIVLFLVLGSLLFFNHKQETANSSELKTWTEDQNSEDQNNASQTDGNQNSEDQNNASQADENQNSEDQAGENQTGENQTDGN